MRTVSSFFMTMAVLAFGLVAVLLVFHVGLKLFALAYPFVIVGLKVGLPIASLFYAVWFLGSFLLPVLASTIYPDLKSKENPPDTEPRPDTSPGPSSRPNSPTGHESHGALVLRDPPGRLTRADFASDLITAFIPQRVERPDLIVPEPSANPLREIVNRRRRTSIRETLSVVKDIRESQTDELKTLKDAATICGDLSAMRFTEALRPVEFERDILKLKNETDKLEAKVVNRREKRLRTKRQEERQAELDDAKHEAELLEQNLAAARHLRELNEVASGSSSKVAEDRHQKAVDHLWSSFFSNIENEHELKKRAEAAKVLHPDLADEIDHRLMDYLINLRERR